MKLKDSDLTPVSKYLFITTMKSAIMSEEMGFTKEIFITFCGEVWESMLLNDREVLKTSMTEYILKEAQTMMDNP